MIIFNENIISNIKKQLLGMGLTTVFMLLIVSVAKQGLAAVDNIIDPHFTGKDCEVCHHAIPKQGQKDFMLKFGNDDIAMCNSCHDKEYLRGDLHPVGLKPLKEGLVKVPDTLPLYDGKVTCRTCHKVYLQCEEKPSIQFENLYFLRGAPYKRTTELCFRCHNKEAYKKINPHEQVDPEGNILKSQCLYCHQSLPDPDKISDTSEVTFKTETSAFCEVCHGEKDTLHPANADHMLEVSPKMLDSIKLSEKRFSTILPLFKGKVFCGTCHNPHDQGVITKKTAAKGASAEMKLRIDWNHDLCVSCHPEKENIEAQRVCFNETPKRGFKETPECRICHGNIQPLIGTSKISSHHKSFVEKKCRACHKITRESPERPVVYKMCFLSDCHDTSILSKTFKHPDALQANCLLCHNQHGSQFGAHIVNDQQKLCKACHPLLSGKDDQTDEKIEEDLHASYLGLFSRLLPDQKADCSYCHGKDHSDKIKTDGLLSCYRCHNFIEKLINDKKGKIKNIHQRLDQFSENECTLCHDPHSSPHPDLLKKDRRAYN